MIEIRSSECADTRTCDYANVSREKLLSESHQHIGDVRQGLAFFRRMIDAAAVLHDYDKISDIDGFHRDFVTGFEQKTWWDAHRQLNRHHLTAEDGIPADVNLIDVLDFVADVVMARAARGADFPIDLPAALLARAFRNTVGLLEAQVSVMPEAPAPV